MKVLITYNIVDESIGDDYLCHYGVMEAVESVSSALKELGYPFTVLGIGDDTAREIKQLIHSDADVVFNLCESIKGKSRLQPCFAGTLELLGIPYTGSDFEATILAIDKRKTKALLKRNSIPTPVDWDSHSLIHGDTSLDDVDFPVIIKPAKEDGSIGIHQSSVVEERDKLGDILEDRIDTYGEQILIERFIAGREFYVGFLGNDPLRSLPIAEIGFGALPKGYKNIMSYQAKWDVDSIERRQFRRICPAEVDGSLKEQLIRYARGAYEVVGLYGYGRIDLRVDLEGNVYVIDVNANPDITIGQGFPLTAEVGGIQYPELIKILIDCAFERRV